MKRSYLVPATLTLLLTACSSPLTGSSKVGVEITGVNYSDQAITYLISDPENEGSVGAEPLNPFTAGGLMCCFSLPEKWRPGIKVRVKILDTHRKPVKNEIVDLPPYVDGKPGRIWAVHYQDGSVDVLSSDYGPPHEKWPGKVKGWPIPTIEYRRKLFEQEIDTTRHSIAVSRRLLNDPNTTEELREMAQSNLQFDTEMLKRLEASKP